MYGIAQQLFIQKYGKIVWAEKAKKITGGKSWPTLEKMLAAKRLAYVDYALAQKILNKLGLSDEVDAALICHLSLASRRGHLCVQINDDGSMTPALEEVWIPIEGVPSDVPIEIWSHLKSLLLQVNLRGREKIASDASSGYQIASGTFRPQVVDTSTTSSRIAPSATSRLVETLPSIFSRPLNPLHPQSPIHRHQNNYYLQRYWLLESLFLRHLMILLGANYLTFSLEATALQRNIQDLVTNKVLLPEQALAVKQGCSSPLTIISGGPGTGKTHTAGLLLKTIWESLSLDQRSTCRFLITAPTGKAAANLEASIHRAMSGTEGFPSLKAQTLHSILRIRKDMPNQSPPLLDADVILVDESSMIDARMMGLLVGAIKPGARLILLGDRHQLPPVESGSLFTDLVDYLQSNDHTKERVVELKTCLRAEMRGIIDLGTAINHGDCQSVSKLLEESMDGSLSFVPVDQTNSSKLQKQLITHTQKLFPFFDQEPEDPFTLLNAFATFRILTPLRKGPLGTEELNSMLFSATIAKARRSECFVVPIMIARNSHQLGLVNGDMGLLIKFHGNKSKDYALFPFRDASQQFRRIPALLLPSYEYAYCISIHKSQGSEFDHVLMLVPEGSEVFGREALYTGATRARRALEVWSSKEILEVMMARTSRRHSGVQAETTSIAR